MAKYSRTIVGSIVKGKDGKPPYLQIFQDVVLKKGQIVNLETKKQKLDNVERSVTEGRLTPDKASEIKEGINKMPEFVLFSAVAVSKED